jgi:hypothetical protein
MGAVPLTPTSWVPRLCRVRTGTEEDQEPFPLDEAGFLADSTRVATNLDEVVPGMLVPPELAASAGSLVLLGEPGVGKTTSLLSIGESRQAGPGASLLRIDGAGITDDNFEQRVGRHLLALPRKANATRNESHAADGVDNGGDVILLIDQLDESPMLRRFTTELETALRDRDTSRLRVLVACRTADYPASLTAVLESALGSCLLADLAPLTRAQAAAFVATFGLDGDALLEAAVSVGAGGLASVPMTLELLVRIYGEERRLPNTAAAVFSLGIRLMLNERTERRVEDVRLSTVDQRLAVAARIAARLVLSGRRTIWTGVDLEAKDDIDVTLGSLADGVEATESGTFAVYAAHVKETLATALYTGQGTGRLGFRHSSLAAYLAALHLVRTKVPGEQLRSLFLVAGEDGTTSIPAALREAAAWLATLDPEGSLWLVKADPEGLAGQSLVIDSSAIRSLLVASLLSHAAEVELRGYSWRRARWGLRHPGLSAQLAQVFEDAETNPREDWAAQARLRLAVRLAHEARSADLVDPLLRVAESPGWNAHLRRLAAVAAFDADPSGAAPRLKAQLDLLSDVGYARQVDSDDELRGTLLDLLWPTYVATPNILAHLRPREHPSLFGSYALFLRTFLDKASDADLSVLLPWIRKAAEDRGAIGDAALHPDANHGTPTSADFRDEDPDSDDRPLGAADSYLLTAVVDRALLSPNAERFMEDVTDLVYRRLMRYEALQIPSALLILNATGRETQRTARLRRALTMSILERAALADKADPATCWLLTSQWHSNAESLQSVDLSIPDGYRLGNRNTLVDIADLEWILESGRAAETAGRTELAIALGNVAAFVFDPLDQDALECAYAHLGNLAGQLLVQWFEAVQIEGDRAEEMRAAYALSKPGKTTPWPDKEAFADRVKELLVRANTDVTDAFWQLLWLLQIDPETGKGGGGFNDNLLVFPGLRLLSGDTEALLCELSARYLAVAEDHAEDWLGTDQLDRRAWAGYVALALLQRVGALDRVPASAWRKWSGAIVWFNVVPYNAGDRHCKSALLQAAATCAPEALVRAWRVYALGQLRRGRKALELDLLDVTLSPGLAQFAAEMSLEIETAIARARPTAVGTAEDASSFGAPAYVSAELQLPQGEAAVEAAIAGWESLVTRLMESGASEGAAAAARVIDDAGGHPLWAKLAVEAGVLLIRKMPQRGWTQVRSLTLHPKTEREFALSLAQNYEARKSFDELPEVELREVYEWLSRLFPPENDRWIEGTHIVGPDEQARELRDRALGSIAGRGTSTAVRELGLLATKYPGRTVISAYLLNAKAAAHANAWSPPHPRELAQLLLDATRRLTRSSVELQALICGQLRAVAEDLPQHGELLWDRTLTRAKADEGAGRKPDHELWRPKLEGALSAYLAHELQLRLGGRGLAVNREVLVRPTNAYGAGERTDILVEANLAPDVFGGANRFTPSRLAVVIEVKANWSTDLLSAQRDQLAVRYLPEVGTDAGVFLVGWFPPQLWTAPSSSRRLAARRDREEVERQLREQSEEILAGQGVRVSPFILDVPRPHRVVR